MKTTTKTKELRAMDETKRREELQAMLREQFNLRMQHATGQLPNHTNLKKVQRNIARLRTVMSEQKSKA
jgi:large subunit ribosomal protein L29